VANLQLLRWWNNFWSNETANINCNLYTVGHKRRVRLWLILATLVMFISFIHEFNSIQFNLCKCKINCFQLPKSLHCQTTKLHGEFYTYHSDKTRTWVTPLMVAKTCITVRVSRALTRPGNTNHVTSQRCRRQHSNVAVAPTTTTWSLIGSTNSPISAQRYSVAAKISF